MINPVADPMTDPATGPKRRHHHGNLREALINAGLELMEQGGADALTLRKCAKRAGVSHAAPAHHFNGLISLQAGIVARGHRMFSKAMTDASKLADSTPHAQLSAICDGYISFARNHSAVFKFMFQPHGIDKDTLDAVTRDELIRDSTASYQILRDACAPFEHDGTDGISTEIMIWSLVHGYAMLFCGPVKTPAPPHNIPDFGQILPKLKLKSSPDT